MHTAQSLPSPEAFDRWGQGTLAFALAGGIGLILVFAWIEMPLLALALPGAVIVGAGTVYLFRRPALNLYVVLVGFVVIADNQAGFQFREIVYALYLYTVLFHWYAQHVLVGQRRLLRTPEDCVLLLFLLLLPFTGILTVVFGGSLKGAASELFSLSLLALYFPLKETIRAQRRGARDLMLIVLCVAVMVAARNMLVFRSDLSAATQAWQIATGRIVTNDNLLMVGSAFGLTLVLFARRWWSLGLSLGGFVVAFAGLALTQSRGYWMAFVLAVGVVFLLVDQRIKKRLFLFAVLGIGALICTGFLLYGAYMELLLEGFVLRLTSIGSAITTDISLVNRFREAVTVMDHVLRNPVLGYGMGVSYLFYDLAHQSTDFDALVHNGYVGLWYKFGLWGLGLIMFFWTRVILRGLSAYKAKATDPWIGICGLAAAASLVAFMLSTITSNPFFLKDSLFIFSVAAGLSAGAWQRTLADPSR